MRGACLRFAISVLALAFVLGCDDGEKRLPLVTKPTQANSDSTSGSVDETTPISAEERAEALRRLDKAIEAHGGTARLTKLRSMVQEMRGVLGPVPAEQKLYLRFPDSLRATTDMLQDGGRTQMALAVNSKRGWRSFKGELVDLSVGELEDVRRELYLQSLLTLLPLKDDGFGLRPLGEANVNDRPASGVLVLRNGSPSVQLFFDKGTNLLTRALVARWREANQDQVREILFLKHRSIDGIMLPASLIERRNNETRIEWISLEYTFPERIDDKLFEKP